MESVRETDVPILMLHHPPYGPRRGARVCVCVCDLRDHLIWRKGHSEASRKKNQRGGEDRFGGFLLFISLDMLLLVFFQANGGGEEITIY